MNKKGFIIIWHWSYFLVVGLLFAGILIYGHFYGEDLNPSFYINGTIKEKENATWGNLFRDFEETNITELEYNIHVFTNEERKNYGIRGLRWVENYARMSREHSRWMADKGIFEHDNKLREGMGENIFFLPDGNVLGCSSTLTEGDKAKCIVDGWMESPGHRENILYRGYVSEGIGVYYGELDGVDGYFITQKFRMRR